MNRVAVTLLADVELLKAYSGQLLAALKSCK